MNNLENNSYYRELTNDDKKIVKFSAYLHDIGKGPKTKWKNGIQKVYLDHPADAIPMLERILSYEFQNIFEFEIQKICFLVIYHDIIGDIIKRGRSKDELRKLHIDKNDLNMLISLSIADSSSINEEWGNEIYLNILSMKEDLL